MAKEAAGEAFDSYHRYLGASWATTRFIVNLQIAAFDWRGNFRRANRVDVQSRVSSRGHRRAADAFVQIISPVDNSAAFFLHEDSRAQTKAWYLVVRRLDWLAVQWLAFGLTANLATAVIGGT